MKLLTAYGLTSGMEADEVAEEQAPESTKATYGCGGAIAAFVVCIVAVIVYDLWPVMMADRLTNKVRETVTAGDSWLVIEPKLKRITGVTVTAARVHGGPSYAMINSTRASRLVSWYKAIMVKRGWPKPPFRLATNLASVAFDPNTSTVLDVRAIHR